ncbi:MAG: shikimate dehydrogenase [Ruminococcus sp.]|nr:shikimate dehydrogenase [Ruminococcus sp.]
MKNYTLIGGKLGHSLSPQIHDRLFALRGREASYDLTELTEEELAQDIGRLRELDGFNVTIPHKLAVMDLMDELDETAGLYGAVNCVANKDGRLIGYNTDCDGFLQSAEEMGARLSGNVLLVGCGGVGRMIAIASALRGASLTVQILESDRPIADTVVGEIRKLAPGAEVRLVTAETEHGEHYDLLVNATPVGMFPKTEACPVSDGLIERSDAVFDVIYNPLETQLIKKARALGKPAENGMAMLVWQAVTAHRLWDGDVYSTAEVRGVIDEVSKLI